jgi:hypothetical protein
VKISRKRKTIFYLMLLSAMFFCLVWPNTIMADDHKSRDGYNKRYEAKKGNFDYTRANGRQIKKGDDGNEISGLTTAWLLVLANLTIVLSILLKAIIHYFPLEPGGKSSFRRLNRLQKKHLMRFHYVLNPAALVLGFFHFILSSCQSSSMPEWGLIMVSVMVFFGIILKFQLFPRKVGRLVYRLHTTPVLLILLVFSVVTGHQFVD